MIYFAFIASNTYLFIHQYLAKYIIFIIRNNIIDNFNEQLFASMRDEIFNSYNINKIMNDEDAEIYMIKYLNIINFSNLSLYKLKLKIDIFIILLYNFNSITELCNKTCLHVAHINQRIIEYEIFNNKYIDNIIIISQISLSLFSIENLSFNFQ